MDHETLMTRAREAWQAAAPSDAEVERAADRVGRRLRSRGKAFPRRKIFVSVGACAAFLAALAYAGNQKWIDVPRPHHEGPRGAVAPSPGQLEPVAPSRWANPTNAIPGRSPTAPAPENESPALASAPNVDAIQVQGTNVAPAPPTSAVERRETTAAEKTSEPSWAEVSDALSGGNEEHAQSLLSEIARHGHDADNRAKAKLGLAQLEASHGNCARARILALQVAAVQGIELKTVRRALELAAHCTQAN